MAASREQIALDVRSGADWAIEALEALPEPLLVIDASKPGFDIIFANQVMRGCLPVLEAPAVGSPVGDLVSPADLPAFLEVLSRISATRPRDVCRVRWLGVEFDPEADTRVIFLSGAGPTRHVLLALPSRRNAVWSSDGTAQPASSGLDWLRLSLRAAHMYAWRWDRATDKVDLLLSSKLIREGREPGFRGMQAFLACVHPADLERVSCALRLTLDDAMDFKEEFRVRVGDADYRWFAVVGRPVLGAPGMVTGLVGATQDVTNRRLSLARASEYSELLVSLTASTRDVLLLLDRNLEIRFCNRKIHGMEPQALVGRSVRSVLEGPDWVVQSERLISVIATGNPAAFAHEALGEDEELHKYESRAIPTFDGERISGLSLVISDITERLRMEREVLEISSREQERISQDLHDGLGQELTGVSLMLRGLATRLGRDDPEVVEAVEQIIRAVNGAIGSARSLARGLSPFTNSRGGLVRALRGLVARSRDLYGLDVRFRSKIWPELTLDENQCSHLYRIAQEALTNIARHAKASRTEVRLSVADGRFTLTIADDGTGLDKVPASGNGMGLKLMAYRADMIGARFEILPNEPTGTIIRVCGEQPPPA